MKLRDDYLDREITSAEMQGDELVLGFADGKRLSIKDDGQCCCEHRYMTTDDDIASLVGGKLLHIESKDGPSMGDEWSEHDTCFVEVQTSTGLVTLVNHNEHNGYYGGFMLDISYS